MLTDVADIYVRLSDEDRNKKNISDESESIQNQKTMLINYCVEKGWQINAIYSDDDYSGADNNRPGWNSVLKDCEEGKCAIVVCKTQSRFSRDMEMIEKYIHGKFIDWGIRFIGVVDNADTAVKGNKKSRQINGLVNEWYLDDLSDNVKATLSTKRKRGDFVGSFAPYGYLVDPNDKNHLVIDEEAAEVVRRIFDMYINGRGYISIAKQLNRENVPPPCVHKRNLGLKYYNSNYENAIKPKEGWSDSSIYAILRRMEYTGTLVQGRGEVINYKTKKRRKKPESEWDIVEGTHLPIISPETFSKAKEIRLKRGKGQKIPGGECYTLARKVFCGECGNTMWKMSYALKDGRYNYLSCKTRKTLNGACGNEHSIRLDELEGIVLDEINKLINSYYDSVLIGEIKKPKPNNAQNGILAKIEKLELEIKKNNERTEKMYTDKLDGIITPEQFATYREKYQTESAKCEKSIDFLIARLDSCSLNTNSLDPKDIIDKYRKIDRLTFRIADEFIEKILVHKKINGEKRKIEIMWRF